MPSASASEFKSEFDIDQLVMQFHRDGFCVLKGLIPKAKLQIWQQEFAPLFEQHVSLYNDPTIRGANRYYVTLPFVSPFADPEIFEHEAVFALVERIVGEDFVMCQLASDTPTLGSDFQDIHSDARPLFAEENIETPSFQLALNFPLCRVTKQNGATDVTRGTHRIKKDVAMAKIDAGEIAIEPLEMELGDAVLRDVRGLHRGTPNFTDVPRPMIVIGYSRRWLLRPEVSIQISRAEFERLSPRAKHMLRFNPITEDVPKSIGPESYKTFAY